MGKKRGIKRKYQGHSLPKNISSYGGRHKLTIISTQVASSSIKFNDKATCICILIIIIKLGKNKDDCSFQDENETIMNLADDNDTSVRSENNLSSDDIGALDDSGITTNLYKNKDNN